MAKKKILYIAQEVFPYTDEILGEQSKVLPLGMLEAGNDIRVFMPKYGTINERRHQLHEVIRLSGVNLTVDDTVHQLIIKVASLMPQRMQVYFIDNEDFFSRKFTTVNADGDLFEDNVERAVFFIRGVFEAIKKLRWVPDIIHCQGWFPGLAPLYIRTLLKDTPGISQAKLVFSIYDMTPKVPFAAHLTRVLNFDGIKDKSLDGSPLSREELIKLIVRYVDAVVFATDEISPDIVTWVKERKGLKSLEYIPLEQSVEAVSDFYDKLLADNNK